MVHAILLRQLERRDDDGKKGKTEVAAGKTSELSAEDVRQHLVV
jgi:hypothetical protein